MNLTYPIRNYNDVQKLKNYFLEKNEYRNYMLITFCLNTALRISDIIGIKWSDITDEKNRIKENGKEQRNTDKQANKSGNKALSGKLRQGNISF